MVGVVGVEVDYLVDKMVEGQVGVDKADFGKECTAVVELAVDNVVVETAGFDMAVGEAAVELASHVGVGSIDAQHGPAPTYVGFEERFVLVAVVNRMDGLYVVVGRVDWVEESDIPEVPWDLLPDHFQNF